MTSKIECSYIKQKLIGMGVYAKVFSVKNKHGETYALKVLYKNIADQQNYQIDDVAGDEPSEAFDSLVEIDILCRLNSPYVIKAKDFY